MGGSGCKSDGDDPEHCELHLAHGIRPEVLRAIREEAAAPLLSAIEGWKGVAAKAHQERDDARVIAISAESHKVAMRLCVPWGVPLDSEAVHESADEAKRRIFTEGASIPRKSDEGVGA